MLFETAQKEAVIDMDSNDFGFSEQPFQSWEYIVDDFLELGCCLRDHHKRNYLLNKLRKNHPQEKSIREHRCFSLGNKLIIICQELSPRECWVYIPGKAQILKWKVNGKNHSRKSKKE